jgi:hypothetical protein
MSGDKELGQPKVLTGSGDNKPTEIDGEQIRWMPIDQVLIRLSKICFGHCWRYHTPYDLSAKMVNMSLNSFCMFFNIARSQQVDLVIREAMRQGFDVYYTRTGRERESPNGEEALPFEQIERKST